ncbi:hypothetical protein EDC04DRAFT_666164 [Pisolithus marmoratus]|nr:hypothetical protein EDC04DRAFT_666164 [Pisolithus marmoratus]
MPSSPTEQNHPGGFRPTHQLYPVSQYDPQPRWGPHQHSQSAPTAPSPTIPPTSSDPLPLYDPTSPLAEYPLGTWNTSFTSTLPSAPTQPQTQAQGLDAGGGEVYYPTAYNIDTFPFVPYAQPSQAQRLHHAYPHPYTQTHHQMPPPSSGHAQIQRRDVYGTLPQMQDNENTGPQSQQQHRQRTDPQQSSPQFIIHQRTQELLAQATLSSMSSIDRQATAENRIGSADSRALMQSGGENRAGTSSTVQERPDHVGMPFVCGSVDDVFYGTPSSSIGQIMGKPNTGAGTGTTTTTTHVGISASTSALDHQGQNMVSAPRAPSTRPSSPLGRFVDRAPQAPAAGEGGPDPGAGGSIQIHPHPHAESQSSHSQNLHTNPQSHPYTHPHSSYIHPRSHSSLSPASYGSYPPTGSSIEYSAGEYSTTGSSAGEYPTTTSSVDEYPTRGAYPPSASLMEQQYHSTGSSVSEYPTVEERGNASVPGPSSVSGSGSLSGQGDGTRYGHGHSESVSTVRGSSMSSSHPYHHEYGAHPVSIAPPTASQQPEHTGGQGRRPGIAQHASASVGSTFQGGIQSQTQQPGGRKVHQYPSRRVRSHHELDQGSGPSSYPHRGSTTTRANVSAQSGKEGQSSSRQGQPQEPALAPGTRSGGATTGATTTTGKRARAPKRLRTGNASAITVPIGGDSDDDSDDEEGDGEPPSTGPGGPGASKGPEVGGTGGGPGGEIGLRK